jgi:outer membrane protein assembly factor BamB
MMHFNRRVLAALVACGILAAPIGVSAQPKAKAAKVSWSFKTDPRITGMYACTPLIDGESVYASFSGTTGYGTFVKLDRQTGLKKWEFFGKNDDFRQSISTPCIADGKLYFGEGFHDDKRCRVFCVDADKGTEVWTFTTEGQTESSPAVAGGKVYIGAGNDGVYCLDAKKGTKIWRFPPPDYKGRLLRFGGGISVVGKRIYAGTGVDRFQKKDKGESVVFCLDADTGKLLWKQPAPYPVWSTPVVKEGVVYVTTGNGDVFVDAQPPDKPGGALLCLKADTGKKDWEYKTPNGIIESPAVDAKQVYFGCRDGQIYCLGRDGKLRWRHLLEAPIIGSPVLHTDASGERTHSVFAAASAGKVCCLDPKTGDMVWHHKPKEPCYISTSPRLLVTPTKDGFRRHLYFGCGLGGGMRDLIANRPVFFCLEDVY